MNRQNRALFAVAVAIVFFFLFVTTATSVNHRDDMDLWFHLSSGKYMVEHKEIPRHDVFSYTTNDRRDVNMGWGSDVIFFLVYKTFGTAGIVALKTFVILAAFAVLLAAAVKLFGRSYLALALLTVVIFATSFRFLARPEIFSYLIFSLLLAVIFLFKYKHKKTLPWLLPLFLIWANLHGGFILGLGILWIFAIGETVAVILQQKFQWKLNYVLVQDELSKLYFWLVLGSIATLANPYGISLIPETIKSLAIVQYATIAEWSPLFASDAASAVFSVAFYALMSTGLLSFFYNYRSFDITNLLVFIALAMAALGSIRNVANFSFGTFLILLVNMNQYFLAFQKEAPSMIKRFGNALIALLVAGVAFASILILIRGDIITQTGRQFGFGQEPNPYAPSVDFINKTGVMGNMFNDYYLGSYLIWRNYPKRSVFIDGRTYLYDKEYFNKYINAFREGESLKRITKEYDINYIITLNNKLFESLRPLEANNDWQLVYFDDDVSIFLRKREENRAILDQYGYSAIDPVKPLAEIIEDKSSWDKIKKEAARSFAINSRQNLAPAILNNILE